MDVIPTHFKTAQDIATAFNSAHRAISLVAKLIPDIDVLNFRKQISGEKDPRLSGSCSITHREGDEKNIFDIVMEDGRHFETVSMGNGILGIKGDLR